MKTQLAFLLLSAVLYNIPRFAVDRIVYETYDNGMTYISHAVSSKLGKETLYRSIYDSVMYFTFLAVLPIFTVTYVNIRLVQVLKATNEDEDGKSAPAE